ncbi:hypothetical protein BDW62DRAFT_212304 [Aspergillus aurantiobrunneus]
MALPLYISPCICTPAGTYRPPAPDLPLRIQIEGPLIAIQRLLPNRPWNATYSNDRPFPQPAGPELARLTYQTIYGRDIDPEVSGDLVVRDEYLGWIIFTEKIDYYGVTFDLLVPDKEKNPEVLQINIIGIQDDNGVYANTHGEVPVGPAEYIGKKVLAVPRCCQKRKGRTDRRRGECTRRRTSLREGRLLD